MKLKMRDDWLAQVQEAPLEPDYPIIDAHHHMWLDHPRRNFSYTIAQVASDAKAGHNILATVFVTCTTQYRPTGPAHLMPVGETEWVSACADEHARLHPGDPNLCAGIVGQVDCRQPPELVDEALQAHQAASPRFRGIRHAGTWSDDPQINEARILPQRFLYMDPAFRKGFSRLARHGQSFDAWLHHDQLSELVDLARTFPDIPIVLDHLGAPLGQGRWASQRQAVLKDWKLSIADLARCPNVHMKLGGTVMRMFGFDWESRPLPPSSNELVRAAEHFFHIAIDAFSPARCMFESNFPVDRVACGYVPLWNSFKLMTTRYSSSERADLFYRTADKFYRLNSLPLSPE